MVSAKHPSTQDMVTDAIVALADRKGSSSQLIKKKILETYPEISVSVINKHVKTALNSGVLSGLLIQTSGKGATGRFKVNKEKLTKPEKKKPVTKRAPAAKKPVAKKSEPKKTSTVASPKQAAKDVTKAAKTTVTADKKKPAPEKKAAKAK